MAPIPIALCGKNLDVAKDFSNLMLPEYEVVHVCQTTESAIYELPLLLTGTPIPPSSSIGTNTNITSLTSSANKNELKQPKALFVGGGWTPESIEEMRNSDASMRSIPCVYPGREFMSSISNNAANAADDMKSRQINMVEKIVEKLKEIFEREGFRDGRMGNGVYNF